MEYIKIEDGKVTGHFSTRGKLPKGEEFKEVKKFEGYIGCDIGMLNDDGSMKSEDELISLGFVEDNRGDYYHTETKGKITISQTGVKVPDKYTELVPSQFDDWDGSKWVESAEKKAEHGKNVKISEAQFYLNSTDYKVIKAMEAGITLDELYPGESAIREEKRQIIRDLSTVE